MQPSVHAVQHVVISLIAAVLVLWPMQRCWFNRYHDVLQNIPLDIVYEDAHVMVVNKVRTGLCLLLPCMSAQH